jgi:S1-C subfamily serine protease
MVVTAAHVVAGETDTVVEQPGSNQRLPAQVFGFDPKNDIAILNVPALAAQPLPLVDPREGAPVAVVGYPGNGPLDSTPARIGKTASVLTDDAYGKGPVTRTITSVGGLIRHGDSGAPAIDAKGEVESTIFAARVGSGNPSGYGVPASVVRKLLASARAPVSSGDCAP